MAKYMVCWCCNHFLIKDYDPKKKIEQFDGYCEIKERSCGSQMDICRSFTIRDGLHTKRKMPEDLYY